MFKCFEVLFSVRAKNEGNSQQVVDANNSSERRKKSTVTINKPKPHLLKRLDQKNDQIEPSSILKRRQPIRRISLFDINCQNRKQIVQPAENKPSAPPLTPSTPSTPPAANSNGVVAIEIEKPKYVHNRPKTLMSKTPLQIIGPTRYQWANEGFYV